jgi:hypothetical protein
MRLQARDVLIVHGLPQALARFERYMIDGDGGS